MVDRQELKYSAVSSRRIKIEKMLIRKIYSSDRYRSLRCLRSIMIYFVRFYECIPDSDIGIAKHISMIADDIAKFFDDKDTVFSDSIWRKDISEKSMLKARQILTEKVLQGGDRCLYEREIFKVIKNSYMEVIDNKEIITLDFDACKCWQNIFLTSSVQEFLSKCSEQETYRQVKYMIQSSTEHRYLLDSTGFLYIQQSGVIYEIPFSTLLEQTQRYCKLTPKVGGEVGVIRFSDEIPFHFHFMQEFTGDIELQMRFEFNPIYLKKFKSIDGRLPRFNKESGHVYIETDTYDLYYAYESSIYRIKYVECPTTKQDTKSYIFFVQEVIDSSEGLYKDTEEQIPLPTAKMIQDIEKYLSNV